jgi:hypothetical protein
MRAGEVNLPRPNKKKIKNLKRKKLEPKLGKKCLYIYKRNQNWKTF